MSRSSPTLLLLLLGEGRVRRRGESWGVGTPDVTTGGREPRASVHATGPRRRLTDALKMLFRCSLEALRCS
eukprot:4379547-Pyramimonas_sp.AAC.2